MSANAVLVRWPQGWRWVEAVSGLRREMTVGLSASSVSEVDYVARRQIELLSNTREEITVTVDPRSDADRFGLGFQVGDTVTVPDHTGATAVQRVKSVTCVWNGQDVDTIPQLKDVIVNEQERFAQVVAKQTQGAVGGVTRAPQPVAVVTAVSNCCPPAPGAPPN